MSAPTRPTGPTLPPVGLWIGGKWRDAADGGRFDVIDPVTENRLAEVAAAQPADVDAAVAAAWEQFDRGEWSRLSGADRGRLLNRLADLLDRDAPLITELELFDIGQPSRGPGAASAALRYFAGWADKIDGRQVSLPRSPGRLIHAFTLRTPVGVVAAITPWNAPTSSAAWKLAPALAAGCTVVLKPPEDAPLTSLHLATLIEEAGFPGGTVNIVPGLGSVAGEALVRHRDVAKVMFTGSTAVGHRIAVAAAQRFTPTTLELGGKSPQLVFADADLAAALPQIAAGFCAHSGQVCAAGSRILVARERYDELVEGLTRQLDKIVVGDPFDPRTTIGSLINGKQLDRVLGHIRNGSEEGGDLLAGGSRIGNRGFFVEPTLFAGSHDLTIAREEIFGPVGLVTPFKDLDEAILLANATDYGLSSTVWTMRLDTAHEVAVRLDTGTVRMNGTGGVPSPQLPFGGTKESGGGRELSGTAAEACTIEKTVSIEVPVA